MVGSDPTGQRKDTPRELGGGPSDSFDFRVLAAPLMRCASVSKSGDARGVSEMSPPRFQPLLQSRERGMSSQMRECDFGRTA